MAALESYLEYLTQQQSLSTKSSKDKEEDGHLKDDTTFWTISRHENS